MSVSLSHGLAFPCASGTKRKMWIIVLIISSVVLAAVELAESAGENCGSGDIMKCMTAISQAASEGRLHFPDTPQKLQEHCKYLMEGLDCAKKIIDECGGAEDRKLYHNLTQDMVGMNIDLCTPGSSLNTRFLKHVDCYKSLSDRLRICSDRYLGNIVVVQSQSLEEQKKMTCCTVSEYNRCMQNAVSGRCEEDAVKLVEDTVITAFRQSFSYCGQLSTHSASNCRRTFAASKGHVPGTQGGEENGTTPIAPSWTTLWGLMVIVVLLVS